MLHFQGLNHNLLKFMRTITICLLLTLSFYGLSGQKAPRILQGQIFKTDTLTLNDAEIELAQQLNDYRRSKGLRAIALSASLSMVARIHVYDLSEHYQPGKSCNLHSWSSGGYWSSCCYTNDHSRAACMWDKPRELTEYQGDGYEIAFFSNYEYNSTAGKIDDALSGWKASRGHHELIVNRGKWADSEWKAMGVGVFGGYIVVWFGEQTDPAGMPLIAGE